MKVLKSGLDGAALLVQLRGWAEAEGFSQIGVADVDLGSAEAGLLAWLSNGFHGAMDYMAAHGLKRARPSELVPGTVRVITARMDYLPRATPEGWQAIEWQRLARPADAAVSIYARGRDYHKVLRARLQRRAERLQSVLGDEEPLGHRVFTDSAPVLEVELAQRSGIAWRGKHTLALAPDAGSMFFLGEIFIDRWLPPTEPITEHCGRCSRCITACPTGAIVAPYRLDARRCISYLTIEHPGAIPVEWREAIGNRIYGCDDCQTVCPWNKFARRSALLDFDLREGMAGATLLALWAWDKADFERRTEGSAIRRIGWQRWRRNLAVALGNAWRTSGDVALRLAMTEALPSADPLVREHLEWALDAACRRQPGEPR